MIFLGGSYFFMSLFMKGVFANRGMRFQIGVLLIIALCGLILVSFVNAAIMFAYKQTEMMNLSPSVLLLTQFIASMLVFLLPALAAAFFCGERMSEFLHINAVLDVRIWMLTGMMTIALLPVVSLTGYLNEQMVLPDFLTSLEAWMRQTEKSASAIVEKILSKDGAGLSLNLLVLAATAGVTEELFFRGALFSIFQKKIRDPHVIIWVVAIVFSAIHLQFYGFVPRVLLGAFLGYLLYWSKSIWLPVAAHFLNNAIVVIGMSTDLLKKSFYFTDNPKPEDLIRLMLAAIVGLMLFAACAAYMKRLVSGRNKALF